LQIPPQHTYLLDYTLRIVSFFLPSIPKRFKIFDKKGYSPHVQTIFLLSFTLSSTMWALYTRALAAAPSAVHANIVNTAANFVVAALCGAMLFGEVLSGRWWVGAGLLVAGTVIIGRGRGVDEGVDEGSGGDEDGGLKKKKDGGRKRVGGEGTRVGTRKSVRQRKTDRKGD
jgi:uncharacterized membrane protein